MQNNIFSGLFVGQNLVSLKEVDSTNTFLKNILSNSKPLLEGTVIMAESQTAGRGQQKNKWHSEPGKNLTFSILLQPSFLSISDQFDLNKAISLGVIDALRPFLGDKLKIKWPNDIYFADKKLGGMLIENMVQADKIKNSIIGIGLNINQDNFPTETNNATSMRQILQTDHDLKNILSEICNNIEAWYLRLRAGKTTDIRKAYIESLYWYDEEKYFRAGNIVFKGTIKDVKNNGLLLVQKGDMQTEYDLKEIEFLNK